MYKSKVGPVRGELQKAMRRLPQGYYPDPFDEDTEPPHERAGFSGTCETTLTDWIQLIQMGRRDAVVRLHGNDGGEATLWCRGGDIIDAVCNGEHGEHAVYRALAWRGGHVSVDFATFSHRRRIEMATTGLLLEAAFRQDTGIRKPEKTADLPPPAGSSLEGTSYAVTGDPVAPSTATASMGGARPKSAARAAVLFSVTGGFVALTLTLIFPARQPTTAAQMPARRSALSAQGSLTRPVIVRTPAGMAGAAGAAGADGWRTPLLHQSGSAKLQYSVPVYLSDGAPVNDVSLDPRPGGRPTAKVGTRTTFHRAPPLRAKRVEVPGRPAQGSHAASPPEMARVQIIGERAPRIQIID